ncbi:hypothetical protein DFP72DRAFT_1073223 [Ephemerocybe angulata]|uniref:Uncharacterized protein n=1 Tax=Ephemerocybe angulata TaxID=980116 RepID=A0A8H6HMK3_9AGAR|nr:hypothetical protein DFP72DRAFT_1073223 [Tulosesus angulatus]
MFLPTYYRDHRKSSDDQVHVDAVPRLLTVIIIVASMESESERDERDEERNERGDEHDEHDVEHDEREERDGRYNQWLSDIFTRAENMALKTDCWLYIAMQESTSLNPAFHYISPRLRRDVPGFLERTHEKVEATMAAAAIVARAPSGSQTRADILAYAMRELKRAKKKTEVAERRLESVRGEIAALRAALAGQK